MKMQMKKAFSLGAWVTATILVVNFVLGLLNVPVREVFGISGSTGITSTIGTKAVTTLQSLVSFDPMSIIYLYLSAVAILLVGNFIAGLKILPKGKDSWQELTLVLLYGTGAFYLLLVGFGLPAMGTLVGLAIYYAVVALSLSLFKKTVRKIL
jgi:hypothetical protein